MNVPVTVVGQRMYLDTGQHRLAPGSQKFIKFIFDLSSDWDGLTVFAQWQQGGNAYNVYLDSERSACLPGEITAGECRMMLYGIGSNNVIGTTTPVRLCITDDMFVADGQSTVITQSLYDQLVEEVSKYIPYSDVATLSEAKRYIGIS